MDNKKVSIIVPCYNVEKYLKDCFQSIKAQTYDNFEVIFVNDGSKDKSLEMIKQFCNEFNKAKFIDQENMGLSEARNSGISIAEGDFLFFYDSDDMLNPNLFRRLVEVIEDNDIAICRHNSVSENYHNYNKKIKQFGKKIIYEDEKLMEEYLSTQLLPNVWNKLYRHDILKQMKNYPRVFEKKYGWGEDYPFNFEYFSLCKKGVYIKDKLYLYRRRKGSLVRSKFNTKMLAIFEAHEQVLDGCEKKHPTLIPYVRAFQCVSCVEMLFRMKMAKFKEQDIIQPLRKLLKENKNSFKKAKRVQWYKKLIRFATIFF